MVSLLGMRCWAFDWPGLQYEPPERPGGRPPPLPDRALWEPGRRWVFDDPAGSGSVWVLAAVQMDTDPIQLLEVNPGQPPDETTVLSAIERRWKGAVVAKARTPGERHPRIWRGDYSEPGQDERERFSGAVTSANVLLDRFRHVLRTIEPDQANRQAFGHEIRQLLILACTDVESAWKTILVENGYSEAKNDRYSTNDYCKLRDVLKLEAWEVQLTMFRRYGAIAPFRGWDPEKPTESLGWYADYNSTKHDRETNLPRANLANLISSIAGLYVMLAAQAGPKRLSRAPYAILDFQVTHSPRWGLADEYVPPIGRSNADLPGATLVPYF